MKFCKLNLPKGRNKMDKYVLCLNEKEVDLLLIFLKTTYGTKDSKGIARNILYHIIDEISIYEKRKLTN